MDKLPNKSVLERVIGCELQSIGIGGYELIFRFFPEDTTITIMTVKEFFKKNVNLFSMQNETPTFFSLIGNSIEDISIIDEYNLELLFSGGKSIIITASDDEAYETVVFKIRGEICVS